MVFGELLGRSNEKKRTEKRSNQTMANASFRSNFEETAGGSDLFRPEAGGASGAGREAGFRGEGGTKVLWDAR